MPFRSILELSIGYLLILVVIWTSAPMQHVIFWTTFFLIAIAVRLDCVPHRDLGFGIPPVRRAFWFIAVLVLGFAAALWLAQALHLLHPLARPNLPVHPWGYLFWALLQQFVLQDFLLARLIRITGNPNHSVLLSGILFAVAHLPNPVLTVTTLLWGTTACLIFLRYRSLYVLAVAHWVLGLSIALVIPTGVNGNMSVGLGYVQQSEETATVVPFIAVNPNTKTLAHKK